MVHPVRAAHHRGRIPEVAARRDQRGVTTLVVALVAVPLLIIAALVIDVGYAKQRRRVVQTGADAAALAAAQELDGTSTQLTRAVAAAKLWARKNVDGLTDADWIGCRDPKALAHRPDTAANDQCISFDSATAPTKVRVRIPTEDQPQFFGMVAQPDPLQVSAGATAGRAPGATGTLGECGLCAWDWIQWSGTVNNQVIGGGTIHTQRLTANWSTTSSTVSPCPIKAVTNQGSNARCPGTGASPFAQVGAAPADPFAGLPDPPTNIPPCRVNGQACNVNSGNAASLLQPGRVFTQSVDLSNLTLNLAPGSYYFAEGFKLNGNVTLNGTGVTLFFVCAQSNQASRPCSSPSQRGGSFEAQGNGNRVNITAPTTGAYAGMAIYFDRLNEQGTAPKFSGDTSTYTFVGSIYAKRGKFTGSGSRVIDVTGRVYVAWWEDNGGGRTTIRFDGGTSTSGSSPGAISLEG